MSGSIPEPEVVTASTGMSWTVKPGLYGPSSLRMATTRCWIALARSGLVGPRLAKVVAPALYGGVVADGRSWKYCGFVNPSAANRDPTTVPSTLINPPFAWLGKASCAKPVNSAGIANPNTAVTTTTAIADD